MPEVNEKVMSMVEEELRKNPDVSTEELRTKAEKLDKSIAKLDKRAFHARYPLQVKRRMAPSRPRSRRRGKAAGAPDRVAIRGVLLDLARAVASAEKADLVDVIGGVDEYVERVAKVVAKS